jgi:putative acetyltransferase
MPEKLEIRESRRDDSAAIESLYPEAFPEENLLPLVRDLLNDVVVATTLRAGKLSVPPQWLQPALWAP